MCRGLTGVEGGTGLTRHITSRLAVRGKLADPSTYIDGRLLAKPNRADFSIALRDISSVEYTPTKKWGMGYYPHDGRVFVESVAGKCEFIILGNQSGGEIAARLEASVAKVRAT